MGSINNKNNNDNDNTGNLQSAYPVAQSAEQYRLNTYMFIEIMNEIMNVIKKKEKKKKKKKVHILTRLDDVVQA